MPDVEAKNNKDQLDIYRRLANSWDVASINRDITFKEAVFVPIEGEFCSVGGAIFLAILAYPEDFNKQYKLVKAIATAFIKGSSPPKSKLRKEIRNSPAMASMIDTPNKRIQQIFSDCNKRLHKRNRVAWVLLHKMASSNDLHSQSPLRNSMLIAARQNTRNYPGFASSNDDEEQIINSFRQRVMTPSRPVSHLALAFYNYFESDNPRKLSILELVQDARNWMPTVVEHGEHFRVILGDIFPRHDNQYLKGRVQNFYFPINESIAVLPFIDPIDPSTDWIQLLRFRIPGRIS